MGLYRACKKYFSLLNNIMLVILALLFTSVFANAQEITAINFNGEPLGKVIPDGKVVSFDNKLLGNVTADSLIINTDGEIIGGVVPQGVAIGNDARLLGKVSSDGSILSAAGQVLGRALPNGLVVNEYFDVLGQVIFPGLVYNDEGKIAGRVTGDGLYTNLGGQEIGIVTPDGYAYRKIGSDYLLDGRLISSKMVVSLSGEFIGSVVPGGQVTDFDSKVIGQIKANGFVYDGNGAIIGKIVVSGYAFDNKGFYLGVVSYNGEVINNNKVVGKIRADGRVIDISDAIIGYTVDFSSTATDLTGRYFGRLLPEGEIAKGTSSNGILGARGQVSNASGEIIGNLIKTGPVFDYKGELKGHALSNGSVISLSGTTIGYMIGEIAYNLSGISIGKILDTKVIFSNDGAFLGVSGINTSIDNKGNKLSVSPQGYVFGQSGTIEGRALNLSTFYTPFGSVAAYQGLNGSAVTSKGEEFGRVVGEGYVLNSQNQMVSKNISEFFAVNAKGEQIGSVSEENILLNKSFNAVAKILPDGSVSEISSGNLNYVPKVGEAYSEIIALDFSGNFLGYADVLGNVNNSSGAKIGQVAERGYVFDNSGIIMGYLASYGGVIDDKCENVGVVASNGGVYNYRGVYIGKVLANGNVISDSGSLLGYKAKKTPVIDFNGRIIGFIDYSGKVSNERGETIGCIDKQGQLRNADKALIGKAIEYEAAIDFDGNIIGYSVVNGLVVDINSKLIGYQQPNDNINSNSGIPLGSLLKYKVAFDLENKFMGYVSKEGRVLDSQHKEIGQVDFDGYVVSSKQKIGYALYDFYVYDNDGKVVGIINRNGEVSSFTNQNLGDFERGFVIKGGKVVARGNRDYNIRDASKLVIGQLKLDGKVLDNLNNVVGTLDSATGRILNANSEVIATATPLQYYSSLSSPQLKRQMIFDENGNFIGFLDENGNIVDANGNIIGRIDENGNIVDLNGNIIGRVAKKGSPLADKNLRAVYDANGNLIGYIDEDGNFLDLNGNIIGRVDENGNIIDANGNIIGRIDENGNFIDANGNIIGRVAPKGSPLLDKNLKAIYDANGNLIGYIDENGNFLDANGNIIGRVDENGNIIDANGNIIGRIDENGNFIDANGNIIGRVDGATSGKDNIYDKDGNIIGYVDREGNVVDAQGKIIGSLNEKGELVDSKGNIIGGRDKNWFAKSSVMSTTKSRPSTKDGASSSLKLLEGSKYYKSLGIALTPDGEYLGDILENDVVIDKDGNIVGYRMSDGMIIDDDGNVIGTEDFSYGDSGKSKRADGSKGKDVFIPAGTFGPGGAYGVGNGPAGNLGPGGGYGPGERYDPTRQAALNAAMLERRQNISVGKISSGYRKEAFDGYQKDWSEQGIPKSISSWRVDMSEMIFSDKPIPAVIARAIDTNNPAPITAYVERNVYAEEGRNVIIPAGSRMIGTFGSITAAAEATSESARVQITWERLIRPDGSIFVFSGQTADAQGRAGALGYVDQQLFKKYTLPVVTTVLTSGASYFIASADDAAGEVETSKQQAASDARQNFLDDMESLFDDILADKTDVKAMTYVPAGTRIIVYPNVDLWLRSVERDSEESQKFQKPEVFIDDVKTGQEIDKRKREDVAKASGGQVVYDPDEVKVEAASSGTTPLIVDTAPKKTTNTIVPPPPPASGSIPAAGSTSSESSASNNADSSIPALF